jgi:hypothetical protein
MDSACEGGESGRDGVCIPRVKGEFMVRGTICPERRWKVMIGR